MKTKIKKWLGIDIIEEKLDGVQCPALFKEKSIISTCLLRKYHEGKHKRFGGLHYNKKTKQFGKEYPPIDF